ncbi:MAG: hypothetical protein ACRDBY_14330 [Cetobacterium sp.]
MEVDRELLLKLLGSVCLLNIEIEEIIEIYQHNQDISCKMSILEERVKKSKYYQKEIYKYFK